MITQEQILGIDEQHLVSVCPNHRLQLDTATAFASMQAAAKNAQIDIQICSSFRSFERQLSIWNRKWLGELPLYRLNGELVGHSALNDSDKIHAIMLWSALPGASRHHWGTDFDVYDKASVERTGHKFKLIPQEYENNGPCAAMTDWLQANAHIYGFDFPYASYQGGVAKEPWHLSYTPVALDIQNTFNIEHLRSALAASHLQGKNAVLSQLASLITRYTFNKGLTE